MSLVAKQTHLHPTEFTPPPCPPPSLEKCSQECCVPGHQHHSTTSPEHNQPRPNSSHSPASYPLTKAHLLPPLIPVIFPRINPLHAPALWNHGFSTLTFPLDGASASASSDALYIASRELLAASKRFFALPSDEKERWRSKLGSEEGWSRVEGEKELVTLRTGRGCPGVLRSAAEEYWRVAVGVLEELVGCVEGSLGLGLGFGLGKDGHRDWDEGGLRELVRGQESMPEERRVATMLRLFRYEDGVGGDGGEGAEGVKVVAEAHRDLGLVSLVIGDKPGLEVWNRASRSWFAIERSYAQPAATVLVGRQLERLSNGRFVAGGHRVVAYEDWEGRGCQERREDKRNMETEKGFEERRYRYSLVLVLRAHSPVVINTDRLTTEITGDFEEPLRGITAGRLYDGIQGSHFNINTGIREREEQRRRLREGNRGRDGKGGKA